MSVYRKEAVTVIVDGRTDHPKYSVYRGMIGRCYEENHGAYAWYGAEGVKVCDEWLDPVEGFWSFAEWHDLNIPEGMSMDKDNESKLYSPATVKAGTVMQQILNTRSIKAHNTSGTQGVRWLASAGAWSCNMDIFTKKVFVGNYASQEEAKEVYDALYGYRVKNPEDKEGIFELVEFYKEERESFELYKKSIKNWKSVFSMPSEGWKCFEEYPSYYFSDMGRIYSLNNESILSPCKSKKDGLLGFKMRNKKVSRKSSVGRFVAELFLPNPENKKLVAYKDKNPENCALDNLLWVTHKELMELCKSDGRYDFSGELGINAKLTSENVKYIRENYKPKDKEFNAVKLADKFGVSSTNIYEIIKGNTFKEVV